METTERLLRLKDIIGDRKTGKAAIVPVSRSHWWQMVKDGKAPAPTKLSERCTVWKLSEVQQFIERGSTNR